MSSNRAQQIPQDQFSNDNLPDYLRSDFPQLLQSLSQHDQVLRHLSVIVSLLELDQISWDYTEYLWKNSADTLRDAWPQLYQIPHDMAENVQQLRATPGWWNVQAYCISKIKAGVLSSCRPKSHGSSLLSHNSSIRSIASSQSNLTRVSSVTSHGSANSSHAFTIENQGEPFNLLERTKSEHLLVPAARHASIAMTPASSTPRPSNDKPKPHICPLCGKKFVHMKCLPNHMFSAHGYAGETTAQPGQDDKPQQVHRKPVQEPSWITHAGAAARAPSTSQPPDERSMPARSEALEDISLHRRSCQSDWPPNATTMDAQCLQVGRSQMSGPTSPPFVGNPSADMFSNDVAMMSAGNLLPADFDDMFQEWQGNTNNTRCGE